MTPERLREAAYALLRSDPTSVLAHLRLYEVEQMLGNPRAAVIHLQRATKQQRLHTNLARIAPARVTLLAVYRVAAWEANLPLELLVDEDRITVHRLYLDDADDVRVLDTMLPPFDLAVCAIAESDAARPTLALAEQLFARIGTPTMNGPARIALHGRDAIADAFYGSTTVLAPATQRVSRAQLAALALLGPHIVRPIGSQAGIGLARIATRDERDAYLAESAADAFFVAPFVDYVSADGYYRKYRIIVVDGVPFAYHLAISPRWMIHYYNAAMAENAWMRDEESAFLDAQGGAFINTHRSAFEEIARVVGLPYFGIDCAQAPDGRLLLFEADAAMLVHGTDPEPFGYKKPAFRAIQIAFTALLERLAKGA